MEHETPVVESGNRMVAGWNPTATNAMTSAAAAAYGPALTADAGSPSLAYLPTSINPTGGAIYASSSDRSAYKTGTDLPEPSPGSFLGAGCAAPEDGIQVRIRNLQQSVQRLHRFLGQRGAVLWFLRNQHRSTERHCGLQYTNTVDADRRSFPNLHHLRHSCQPHRSDFGQRLRTSTRTSIRRWPSMLQVKVPYSERLSVDVQHQFGTNWMVEVGYIMDHGVHLDLQQLPSVRFRFCPS